MSWVFRRRLFLIAQVQPHSLNGKACAPTQSGIGGAVFLQRTIRCKCFPDWQPKRSDLWVPWNVKRESSVYPVNCKLIV